MTEHHRYMVHWYSQRAFQTQRKRLRRQHPAWDIAALTEAIYNQELHERGKAFPTEAEAAAFAATVRTDPDCNGVPVITLQYFDTRLQAWRIRDA